MKSFSQAILYGLLAIFMVIIVLSLIFSMILKFTSLQETSIQLLVTILSFFTLFMGGFISGGKGKQKGWLIGGITGGFYTVIVFLFQYLGHDTVFNGEQIIYHVCYILTAMMGGVLGVNLSGGKPRES
ncbi:putative membrane protein (TIGR04086 family) [Oikeobacillus pervagus]|uniref:Membrane protein (TIGR04086 family) n=1 Tax=Oikeobacillus pervagus TaxID=1325931 RepID=A0AAJ1SXN9_9BACI|nr:TIGR04086 family membrane protein [Oikeobacillus pervagus]MDQ0214585.1 putative membrane protein (TIGR04086 family) [Oikeobacillus pervagus]